MIRHFDDILRIAKERGPKTIAVAVAQDLEVLIAVNEAKKMGIADSILVGDQEKIEEIAKNNGIDIKEFAVVDVDRKSTRLNSSHH